MEVLSTFKTVENIYSEAQTLVNCPYSYVAIHIECNRQRKDERGFAEKDLTY